MHGLLFEAYVFQLKVVDRPRVLLGVQQDLLRDALLEYISGRRL
jgi:hypothetical protein